MCTYFSNSYIQMRLSLRKKRIMKNLVFVLASVVFLSSCVETVVALVLLSALDSNCYTTNLSKDEIDSFEFDPGQLENYIEEISNEEPESYLAFIHDKDKALLIPSTKIDLSTSPIRIIDTHGSEQERSAYELSERLNGYSVVLDLDMIRELETDEILLENEQDYRILNRKTLKSMFLISK